MEAKNPDIPDPCGNNRIGRRPLALAREYQFGHRYKSQPGVAQGGGRNEEVEATNMGNSSRESGPGRSEWRGDQKARQHRRSVCVCACAHTRLISKPCIGLNAHQEKQMAGIKSERTFLRR